MDDFFLRLPQSYFLYICTPRTVLVILNGNPNREAASLLILPHINSDLFNLLQTFINKEENTAFTMFLKIVKAN